MHNLAHYEAILSNQTFSSLSNYTCKDADGCLERQGSYIWTALDGVMPLKVTDFCCEPPEIYDSNQKNGWKIRFSIYTFPKMSSFRLTALRNYLSTEIGAIKFRVSLFIP